MTGKQLKRWRVDLGLTVGQAASLFDVHIMTYRRWEYGTRTMSKLAIRLHMAIVRCPELVQVFSQGLTKVDLGLTSRPTPEENGQEQRGRQKANSRQKANAHVFHFNRNGSNVSQKSNTRESKPVPERWHFVQGFSLGLKSKDNDISQGLTSNDRWAHWGEDIESTEDDKVDSGLTPHERDRQFMKEYMGYDQERQDPPDDEC